MKIVRNIKVVIIPCDSGMTVGLIPYLEKMSAVRRAFRKGRLNCSVVDKKDPRHTELSREYRIHLPTSFVMITHHRLKKKWRRKELAHTLDRMIVAIEKYTEEDI